MLQLVDASHRYFLKDSQDEKKMKKNVLFGVWWGACVNKIKRRRLKIRVKGTRKQPAKSTEPTTTTIIINLNKEERERERESKKL